MMLFGAEQRVARQRQRAALKAGRDSESVYERDERAGSANDTEALGKVFVHHRLPRGIGDAQAPPLYSQRQILSIDKLSHYLDPPAAVREIQDGNRRLEANPRRPRYRRRIRHDVTGARNGDLDRLLLGRAAFTGESEGWLPAKTSAMSSRAILIFITPISTSK